MTRPQVGEFEVAAGVELDADRFAVLMSLMGHVRSGNPQRQVSFRVRMWFTAATLLFFVLDNPELPWHDMASTHPHPLVRWALLPHYAMELYGEQRKDELFAAFSASQEDLSILLAVVGLPQGDLLGAALSGRDLFADVSYRAYKDLRAFMDLVSRASA